MGWTATGFAKTLTLIGFFVATLVRADTSAPAAGAATAPPAISIPVITVHDSINPGTGAHISESMQRAADQKAPFVVLALNTPGGLLSTTRQIIQDMLNLPIPVVVYVSPKGAHAGSAGALITFASDVAVMAPGTNIGAAHPVAGGGEKMDDTMAAKMANDTAAFAEALPRPKVVIPIGAEKAVKSSESITSEEAVKQGVVDFVAQDMDELAAKLSGWKLKAKKANTSELPTGTFQWQNIDTKLRHRIVSFFSDPSLAYLIMSLGALCIWIELLTRA